MIDGPKMVEIPLSHARLLAKAMTVVEDTPICKELLESLESAIGLAEVRSLRTFLGMRPALGAARRRPHWDYVARAIVAIDGMVRDDPAALARSDAVQAYVRDTFDALGISVHDEHALYVAITTAGLMVEMAENGRKRDVVDQDTVRAIATISQSFTAALIDYLPAEARTKGG